MVAYAADGGTEELPVPEEMRTRPALTDQQVKGARPELGNRIEAYYGSHKISSGGSTMESWYLLQSRPITTLSLQTRTPLSTQEISTARCSSRYSRIPSPRSSYPSSSPCSRICWISPSKSLGFEPPKDMQAIGGFYNQPYFNRDYIAAAFQPLSPAVREPLIAQIVNPFGASTKSQPKWSCPCRFAHGILGCCALWSVSRSSCRACWPPTRQRSPGWKNFRIEYRYRCWRSSEQIYRLPFEYANKLLNNDFLMIAVIGRTYRLLGTLLKRYYGADTDEVVAKLISGVTGNVTMETNKRLWDLAQIARSSPTIARSCASNDYHHSQSELLQNLRGRA